MNSGDTHVDVSSFRDHIVEEAIEANVPLLLQNQPYGMSKSFIYDELRNFRISLKWCALDHSTYIGKLMSYTIFILLTICVPILKAPRQRTQSPSTSWCTCLRLPWPRLPSSPSQGSLEGNFSCFLFFFLLV